MSFRLSFIKTQHLVGGLVNFCIMSQKNQGGGAGEVSEFYCRGFPLSPPEASRGLPRRQKSRSCNVQLSVTVNSCANTTQTENNTITHLYTYKLQNYILRKMKSPQKITFCEQRYASSYCMKSSSGTLL